MHVQSEKTLREIARNFIQERDDIEDAWSLYKDEARARYGAEDDGDGNEYFNQACKIFVEEQIAENDQAIEMADDTDDAEEGPCSICGQQYQDWGNNAAPVNDGRCCNECNSTRVIPARLALEHAGER
jgi:hypothetical protein